MLEIFVEIATVLPVLNVSPLGALIITVGFVTLTITVEFAEANAQRLELSQA